MGLTPEPDDTAQRVVQLWNKLNGWIPGAAYKQLAEALRVDPATLLHARQTRMQREDNGTDLP